MPTHPAVLEGLRGLRRTWPARGWSYDDRFECVASTFDADFAPQARLLLASLFREAISERTLPAASDAIREVAARTGGVRAAQLIFAAAQVNGVTPYALWWPWEEAQTISLRVGLEGASRTQLEELRSCFDIPL